VPCRPGGDLVTCPSREHDQPEPSLTELELSGNQLRDLPAQLGRLTKVQFLTLDGNPLQEPLARLVPQGIDAVLAYLRGLLPPPGPAAA
jgi:hypothetical protein